MAQDEASSDSQPASAAQLRREAGTARDLAAGACSEEDRRRFKAIADTLDREAAEIERAITLLRHRGREAPPDWMVAPPFRDN